MGTIWQAIGSMKLLLCTKLLADYAGPVVKRETAYAVKPIHDTHFTAHIH